MAYGLRLLIEGFILADTSPISVELYWINNATPSQVASKAIYVTNVRLLELLAGDSQSDGINLSQLLETLSWYGACTLYGDTTPTLLCCHPLLYALLPVSSSELLSMIYVLIQSFLPDL